MPVSLEIGNADPYRQPAYPPSSYPPRYGGGGGWGRGPITDPYQLQGDIYARPYRYPRGRYDPYGGYPVYPGN